MPLIKLILLILRIIFVFFSKKYSSFTNTALLFIQVNYFHRYFKQHNIQHRFSVHEKQAIHFLFKLNKKASAFFPLIAPQTILNSWKYAIARYWTRNHRKPSPGRPRISKKIRELIKQIKMDNYLWGCRRIRDELLKLSVDVSHESIRTVIQHYRKISEITPNLSWKRFLSAHWKSLFACDFFTVDIWGFIRFSVFFILKLDSRKIVHWNLTTNPDIPFLRKQLSHFKYEYPDSFLIHDNSGELKFFPYKDYRINDVPTVPYSPNMNAYAERFVRSIRQECLDHFIIFNQTQLRNIIKGYIDYYNNNRPHQGFSKPRFIAIPNAPPVQENNSGKIKKKSVLFGLHHHYYRESA